MGCERKSEAGAGLREFVRLLACPKSSDPKTFWPGPRAKDKRDEGLED